MKNQALKLVVCLIYSIFVAFTNLEYYYLIPIFLILYFERKYFFKILKKIFLLNFFIIFLVLFVAFEDINKAVELFLRTNLILSFNVIIFYKSKAYDIIRGLNSLKFSAKIITIFYFTISLIEFLTKEFQNIKVTLKLRNFKAKTSLYTYKTFGNIFALMFIKAIKKSEEIKDSMKTRGYNGKIYLLNSTKVNIIDIILVVLITILILIKVIL